MARLNKPQAELVIYNEIGTGDIFGEGTTAREVYGLLKQLGDRDLTVRLNSPGGDASEGVAICNLLKAHRGKVRVVVDGEAASAASVVAMAGDPLQMAPGSWLMIHEPWTMVAGGAADLRVAVDMLETIFDSILDVYEMKSGIDPDQLAKWVRAETWFSAQAAVDEGFADALANTPAIAASKTRPVFHRNPPQEFLDSLTSLPLVSDPPTPEHREPTRRERAETLSGRLAKATRRW